LRRKAVEAEGNGMCSMGDEGEAIAWRKDVAVSMHAWEAEWRGDTAPVHTFTPDCSEHACMGRDMKGERQRECGMEFVRMMHAWT